MIKVKIFLAENCSHCNTMLKPILPELAVELKSRGMILETIEVADKFGYGEYWDYRRKSLKDYAYNICATPYIVIEGQDSQGEWRRRAILGVLPNREDYRAMILFEIAKALVERYIDSPEGRLGLVMRLYSRYFSETEKPDGMELYDVISDIMKTIRRFEVDMRISQI